MTFELLRELPATVAGLNTAQISSGSILQISPDASVVMAQKDYASERWSITLNRNTGVYSGNVFKTDGSPASFVWCPQTSSTDQDITFSCQGADACRDSTCPGVRDDGRPDWVFIADQILPRSFFEPRAASAPAGRRNTAKAINDRAAAEGSGSILQIAPDTGVVLIQKDYGSERWSISYDPNTGVYLGNVYKTDGSPPSFVWCETASATDNDITFACSGADACIASSCPGHRPDGRPDWVYIASQTLPRSFFAARPADESQCPQAGEHRVCAPPGSSVQPRNDFTGSGARWGICNPSCDGLNCDAGFKTCNDYCIPLDADCCPDHYGFCSNGNVCRDDGTGRFDCWACGNSHRDEGEVCDPPGSEIEPKFGFQDTAPAICGASCTTIECPAGLKVCNDYCIAAGADCCPDHFAFCPEGQFCGDNGGGGYGCVQCQPGSKPCNGTCIRSRDTCCNCPTPFVCTSNPALCCPEDHPQLCNDTSCLARDALCCGSGTKECFGRCISNEATCCQAGYQPCNGSCIPDGRPCCAAGYKPCGRECISNGTPCCGPGTRDCDGVGCIPIDAVCCNNHGTKPGLYCRYAEQCCGDGIGLGCIHSADQCCGAGGQSCPAGSRCGEFLGQTTCF